MSFRGEIIRLIEADNKLDFAHGLLVNDIKTRSALEEIEAFMIDRGYESIEAAQDFLVVLECANPYTTLGGNELMNHPTRGEANKALDKILEASAKLRDALSQEPEPRSLDRLMELKLGMPMANVLNLLEWGVKNAGNRGFVNAHVTATEFTKSLKEQFRIACGAVPRAGIITVIINACSDLEADEDLVKKALRE